MNKIILVLDVDGVLNPAPWRENQQKDFTFDLHFTSDKDSGEFPLHLSTEMGKALQETFSFCTPFWLTTWIVDSNQADFNIGSKLGWNSIPELPTFERKDHILSWPSIIWKGKFMMDFLKEPGNSVIWFDDNITEILDSVPISLETFDPHKRLILAEPNPLVGITKSDVLKIHNLNK